MTEWSIGGIAGQTTQQPISQLQAPTSDWPLILRYTPPLPTVWRRHVTHKISEGRGVVVSGHLAMQPAPRRRDLPLQSISEVLTFATGLLVKWRFATIKVWPRLWAYLLAITAHL